MTCPVDHGRIALDPLVRDLVGEGARLRQAGPVIEIEVPGGVECWAVTRHAEARRLLTDPRLVKDINRWGAWTRGEIPSTWPLIGLVAPGTSMVTADGDEHKRQRLLTAQALTPRRMERLRPRIEEITRSILDELEAAGAGGAVVDFKSVFAFKLPMRVISELMGVEAAEDTRLRALYDTFFSSVSRADEVRAAMGELFAFFAGVVAEKKRRPGDDLTSALLAATEGGDRLSDEELIGTLLVMIAAGHETTINLMVSAVRGLLTHPDQLALVRSGGASWSAVVEETLRWSPPTTNFLFRYATEDIPTGDVVIKEGDAVMISYGAIGRDEAQHGPTAEAFDITRDAARHLSFGYGPHVCPGAPLGRLEALVALPALFERFPDLALAVPEEQLENTPSILVNSLRELPVRLTAPRA
ncbi:cytochrome P450 family protein [Streptomyces sp. H39-S7]|uniref:cytochrome P450 family protein n=1 Tax=Streptomyces sp. H39-S7 TaxID=3004357 RepID=UPI0022AFA558|nr:cytochrome P450 [Streptomyces sp. H39-S7]MCZ4122847.1 cytochrome P450 [Streptomyces sp. H39-S7]